jgi:hypothetical protein
MRRNGTNMVKEVKNFTFFIKLNKNIFPKMLCNYVILINCYVFPNYRFFQQIFQNSQCIFIINFVHSERAF